MKKQWRDFLEKNTNVWSYNIVPQLVIKLEHAIDVGDVSAVINCIDALIRQGVLLDEDCNLCFVTEIYQI